MISTQKLFAYYKSLADKAIDQISEKDLFISPNPESNSIAIIIHHMAGNMLSRWTDFLNSDGEKEWRNRDEEFEAWNESKENILKAWQEGWKCLFDAINPLTDNDLNKIVYIRNEGHTVQEALLRQIAHYAYHVGQIVFLAKALKGEGWHSLSIPRNASKDYNKEKFDSEKKNSFFTDRV